MDQNSSKHKPSENLGTYVFRLSPPVCIRVAQTLGYRSYFSDCGTSRSSFNVLIVSGVMEANYHVAPNELSFVLNFIISNHKT